MDDISDKETAVELLQQLGLKEYEAKCFVALTRLPSANAKEISDASEVPRTRVYDAARVLETKGLIEIQHGNPQQFRAVPITEAIKTLQKEYEDRTETLRDTLEGLGTAPEGNDTDEIHEIWSLSGGTAIEHRTLQLFDEAESELVVVAGDASLLSAATVERLHSAQDRGVTVLIGAVSDELQSRVQTELPDAEVFVSGLEWLASSGSIGGETEINRIVLVDRSTILVSTRSTSGTDGSKTEQAVFGRGFNNGLVAITRRLMATGLAPGKDPGTD
jgi:sugar-specific transcriptional regulator TrmB